MARLLVELVQFSFLIFNLLILARVLMSWFNPDPSSAVVRTIYQLTEPILAPIRRLLPSTGMFDLSPMVALIGAIVLEALILQLIIALV
ncbi:MAG: YggT family protein [Candidatus Thermofonsia Clade 1 bacterium]|jgi:YggT family protein|uniref:YggT family protein n=1 Tax=Candidatus Thermofonsia Clade 1 bacterium TaxID=2364210 RepID=A0A2M8PBF4_9CHLR|nr:MAG: YggT family protein [Candidatus Thermofonsia Clade 1 bacterium]PJF42932.1 MAG: YggT family protein [Candidatus Thermofonsia Clade 1 bacterium]RMF49302.1 MAG: YggT family protein [Chloroflexota bacterium]